MPYLVLAFGEDVNLLSRPVQILGQVHQDGTLYLEEDKSYVPFMLRSQRDMLILMACDLCLSSVSQISNFYTLLWKEMTLSNRKIIEALHSGSFIFVPRTYSCSHQEDVDGALLSVQEVYRHDSTCSMDQMNLVHPECVPGTANNHLRKIISIFYPNLHDFFVNECGVDETPPLCSYLQILLQLSSIVLPHQAAKMVFEVFLK